MLSPKPPDRQALPKTDSGEASNLGEAGECALLAYMSYSLSPSRGDSIGE